MPQAQQPAKQLEIQDITVSPKVPTPTGPITITLTGQLLGPITKSVYADVQILSAQQAAGENRRADLRGYVNLNPCPVGPGANTLTLNIPGITAKLPQGNYDLQIVAKDEGDQEVACLDGPFSVTQDGPIFTVAPPK
ncbi:hypothetical protein HDV00_004310 [Rhizophlyctis rosea]|nr:hypothetical protein HDV00_004310 [Rhizophlyctis rosea]